MLNVGLTGGIGAGKTTVSRRLRELGAILIDADQLAREVVEPGTSGLASVKETFGVTVLNPDGSLNRAKLAEQVFGDPEALQELNEIVHPLVHERREQLSREAPPDAVIINDIPLLFENGLQDQFDHVVVVESPLDLRLERLARIRDMPEDQARARIARQATDEQRRSIADTVLLNDRGQEELFAQVDMLWNELKSRAAA